MNKCAVRRTCNAACVREKNNMEQVDACAGESLCMQVKLCVRRCAWGANGRAKQCAREKSSQNIEKYNADLVLELGRIGLSGVEFHSQLRRRLFCVGTDLG
jgi:hypothetical protein